MKSWSKWFTQQLLIDAAVVSGVAAVAFYQVKRGLAARRQHQADTAERIQTWEGEGGNVPVTRRDETQPAQAVGGGRALGA